MYFYFWQMMIIFWGNIINFHSYGAMSESFYWKSFNGVILFIGLFFWPVSLTVISISIEFCFYFRLLSKISAFDSQIFSNLTHVSSYYSLTVLVFFQYLYWLIYGLNIYLNNAQICQISMYYNSTYLSILMNFHEMIY